MYNKLFTIVIVPWPFSYVILLGENYLVMIIHLLWNDKVKVYKLDFRLPLYVGSRTLKCIKVINENLSREVDVKIPHPVNVGVLFSLQEIKQLMEVCVAKHQYV